MPNTLIGRAILWELIKVSLLTLVGISGLFVLGGAMWEANKLHLHPMRVLQILPLLIPPTLPYSIPTSFLFACTFVYSRLSSNHEIVALKAGGVHVIHALAPAIFVGVSSAALGLYITDQFIPSCQARLHKLLMDDVEANIFAYLKQQGMIVDPKFPYEIYVDEVRDGRLINAIFKQRGPDGKYDLVAKADEATLAVVQASHPSFEEPHVEVRLMNSVAWSRSAQGHWNDQTYRMPLPTVARADHRTNALSFAECRQTQFEHQRKAKEADFFISSVAIMNAVQGDFVSFAQMLPSNRIYADRQDRRSSEMQVEIHSRLCQSAAPCVFAMLGCPIGILLRRRDFLQTFFVSFLPIVLIFYPGLILARNLVKEGHTSPALTVWAPSAAFLLISLPLLLRVIRR